MLFTFGSDPEFALVNNGKYQSAISLLPTKTRAIHLSGTNFYFDNVLAEVAIRPSSSKAEAVESIGHALRNLAKIINPVKIGIRAAMLFPASELRHKKAIEAGCVPELSAYTLNRVLPPEQYVIMDPESDEMRHITPLRTVGGHIHLGAKEGPLQHGMLIPYVVKMLDLFLGIPELFFNKDKTSKDRRKVYGMAGTHRCPKYGLEYRPLSNFWLSSPLYVRLVYDICDFTLDFVKENGHEKFWTIDQDLLHEDDPSVAHHCYGYDVQKLRHAIDNCDKTVGKPFLSLAGNELPARIMDAIDEAIEYEPRDLYEEWSMS